MGFDRKLLNTNEEILLDLRPHWWFVTPQAALALLALVVVGVVAGVQSNNIVTMVAGAFFVLALLNLAWRWINWNGVNFVITTDRLVFRTGVIAKKGIEIPLERVNTVFFKQTLFERMIGSGDLAIESAGEQGAQMVDNIRKPLNVQNEIYRQMENNENRKFDRVGRNLPQQAPSSIPDQIEKLAELRQQGVLTDAEFQAKKRELLDRM